MESHDFKFPCPHCKQGLQCEPRLAGMQIHCPHCNHLINIPNPPARLRFTGVFSERTKTRGPRKPGVSR